MLKAANVAPIGCDTGTSAGTVLFAGAASNTNGYKRKAFESRKG